MTVFERQVATIFFTDDWRSLVVEALWLTPRLLEAEIAAAPEMAEANRIQQICNGVVNLRNHLLQIRDRVDGGYEARVAVSQLRIAKAAVVAHCLELKRRRETRTSTATAEALAELDRRIAQLEMTSGSVPLNQVAPDEDLISVLEADAPEIVGGADPLAEWGKRLEQQREATADALDISDAELQHRCQDLFKQFRRDQQHDRFDQILSAATTVLEDRLRRSTGAPTTIVGADLATYAFGRRDGAPRLNLSDHAGEQDAGHQLWRAVFGYIRNPPHHRLIGDSDPRRVRQVIGFIDYLLEELRRVQAGAK